MIKRSRVLHHFQYLSAQIVYLQETHLEVSDHSRSCLPFFIPNLEESRFCYTKSIPFICWEIHHCQWYSKIILQCSLLISMLQIGAMMYFLDFCSLNYFMYSQFLILGGDFNCWLNPKLDCSSTRDSMPSRSAKIIQSFITELAFSDPWRFF